MEKRTRNALFIGGGLIGLTAIIFGVRAITKDDRIPNPDGSMPEVKGVGGKLKDAVTGKTSNPDTDVVERKAHFNSDEGFVNVRTTPKVDNFSVFDWDDNLLGKISVNPVGTVVTKVTGDDGYRWYRINLRLPIDGKKEGYVREDAITLK